MKKVSVMIPTYNEEDNVAPLSKEIIDVFERSLPEYDYEIVFIDNFSSDNTRDRLTILCAGNRKIKAIFNSKNFGQVRSSFYGLTQVTGDCVILMCADFQDPIDMLPKFVREWENGYKIVIGIKTTSKENGFMYFLRTCYYKIVKKIGEIEHIKHFTGFGLYDRKFIDILKSLEDPLPYLRGIVAELGFERKEIPYEQAKRKSGKTKNNFYSLYDIGMLGITSYSKVLLRIATMLGFVFSTLSLLIAFVYFVLKLILWDKFPLGTAPQLIGTFLIGSIQIFFIGLIGEYVLNINTRVMKRPLVVEEKRINFD
jgi:polyisoprenyl-phosphate glycosyltransferase